MKELPNSSNDRFAIIKYSNKGKKTVYLGLFLCLIILLILGYLWSQKVSSLEASIEGDRHIVYSPVAGRIVELPKVKGDTLRKGDALLRFDPMFIRRQNSNIREYLEFFQNNKHNPGRLRSKFSPIFSDIFGDFTKERKILLEKELMAKALYEQKTLEHSKIVVQMRNPAKQRTDGKTDPELAKLEQTLAKELESLLKNYEIASMARAEIDREIREVTNDLGKPHGMLYIYLEEEYKKAQKVQQYEYLYANSNGEMGEIYVKTGSYINENTALYEILPEASGQWFVHAIFDIADKDKLAERDICKVVTENGLEFEARIESIKVKGEFLEVRLIVQKAPEGLEASKFAKVSK